MKRLTIISGWVFLILVLGSFDKPVFADINSWERGVAVVSFSRDNLGTATSDASLEQLAATGANYVSLVPGWVSNSRFDSNIFPDPNTTPSDAALVHAIQKAHQLGLRVMILPHLDPYDGSWAGAIQPNDVNAWFVSYTNFIMHYAQIAQANGVEQFGIGRELVILTTDPNNTTKWRALLANVRSVFSGKITYQANWGSGTNEEFTRIPFWDDPNIDLIGISGFFPLSQMGTVNPSVSDLVAGWQPWISKMANFYNTVGKPIVFGEVGYRSIGGAAAQPFAWDIGGSYDALEQQNCYEAFFEALQNEAWFAGGFWWNWQTNPDAGGQGDTDYTPQNKPAENVLNNWFHGGNIAPSPLTGDIALTARATASSENTVTQQLAIKAIDGVIDGYPSDFTKEWAADGELAGAWLRLDWNQSQSVNKVILHDRINLDDQITAGHIVFSDGSTISVGTLPNNGDGLVLTFSDRTVTSLTFYVDDAMGNNTGLAEIEVYGSSQSNNHPPSITSGPTVVPSIVNPGQTASLKVTATDADGDLMSFTWSATAGSISGSGPNVTFTAPSSGGSNSIVTVTVTDGRGASTKATTTIVIKQPGRPILMMNTSNVDFGNVPAGVTSIRQITVRNVGDTGLSINSLGATSGFGVSNPAPMAIQPNGQATVVVTYTPTGSAPQVGQLTIASNAPDTPQVIVGLSGTGASATSPTASTAVLSSVTPNRVLAGIGDFTVNLTGRLFASGLQATAIINNVEQNIPTVILSDTQAKVTVPAAAHAAEGIFYIRVHNVGGAASATVMVFVAPGQPILNSISPNTVAAGAGDVQVAFTGMFFSSQSRVVVKSGNTELMVLPASSLTRSVTHLDAVIPASVTAASGVYSLFVRTSSDQVLDSSPFSFTVGQQATQVVRNINFGSSSMLMPAGFNGQDSGQVFNASRGYGWSTSLASRAVGPTVSTTRVARTIGVPTSITNTSSTGGVAPQLASYISNLAPATWFINLPNGTYNVEVSVGCQDKTAPHQSVSVQGVSFFSDSTTSAGQFKSFTATVTVQNGMLSMNIGNGVGITYVNYIKIASVQLFSAQTPTSVQSSVSAQPSAVSAPAPTSRGNQKVTVRGNR
ncbi:MAG TPA: glycoside hydrolase TIM-barrel-like domain-containing protein [Blastocatellia bacterium]|nr:glycoside hydrolase TIM-barrel-like domain-containing protein [Blastocatellia bacterium]